MLTRLEVDGFKNLNGFVAEFGAFTCIAGENGVGKSNIFDAIEFLALIADRGLMDAARELRSTRQDASGDAQTLFVNADPSNGPIRLCAEMIVPREVEDDFGAEVRASITFLRYEVVISFAGGSAPHQQGRLLVESESLAHINIGDASRHLAFPSHAKLFRSQVVTGRRSGGPFISTEQDQRRIIVHQDGGSRGRPRRQLPIGAATTVVSTINTTDDPTILAARREMQNWRRLALEPTALRAADRFSDPAEMTPDGRHLAAALHRIANARDSSGSSHPEDVYARIASRLSGLSGVDVARIRVDADEARQLFTLMVADRVGHELPARSLSEGTLRYLALCVMLEDPTIVGLICMEEPENGIHPGNLSEMVNLVRDLAVDPHMAPGVDNPLRQVIVNTHSPAVVQLVGPDDLLLATEQRTTGEAGDTKRSVVVSGVVNTWRDGRNGNPGALKSAFLDFLSPPPGAQFSLFHDVA